MTMERVYATIMIYNEPYEIIKRCLDTLNDVVDGVIFMIHEDYVDEELVDILCGYNFISKITTENLDKTVVEDWRNFMIDQVEALDVTWVLVIDPDEYLNDIAMEFVKSVKKGYIRGLMRDIVGFVFPRYNYERSDDGTDIIYGKNYPDYQCRLFKSHLRYSGEIHQQVTVPIGSKLNMARGEIVHDKRYESYDEWKRKVLLFRSKGGKDNAKIE